MKKQAFFKFPLGNKKARVDLATWGLVSIILAIVFLALALAFQNSTQKFHKKSTEEFFDEILNQRVANLRDSEKEFDIEFPVVPLEPGNKAELFLVLTNPFSEENQVDISHTVKPVGYYADCSKITVLYPDYLEFSSKEAKVPPLRIYTDPNINKGSCFYEITAQDSHNNSNTIELIINII